MIYISVNNTYDNLNCFFPKAKHLKMLFSVYIIIISIRKVLIPTKTMFIYIFGFLVMNYL